MRPILFIILFLSGIITLKAQSITIPSDNSGASTGSLSLHRKPLGSYYGYERSAFIYTSAELGIIDTVSISQLAFYVDSLNNPASTTPVKIYMKDISDTAFAGPTTEASEISGASLLFDGSIASTSLTTGSWINISLSNAFVHYPAQNLEIIIETNAGSAGNEGNQVSKGFRHNYAGAKRFQYWQQDNTIPTGTGTLDTLRPNITINYSIASVCSGTPSAGSVVVSDTAVCVGKTVNLTLQGNSSGAQITYQWMSSADGITFADISGANQFNYTATINDTTFFKCVAGCGGSYDTSSAVVVHLLLPVYCYCYENLGGNCANYSIDSVSIEGTSFQAALDGCENNVIPHYSKYAPNGNYTTTLTAGQAYTLTIRQTGNNASAMWIDLDHSGTFDLAEYFKLSTASVTGGFQSFSFTMPANSYNGLTGMRFRTRASGVLLDSVMACTSFGTGETEDFLITIDGGWTIGLDKNSSEEELVIYPNPNNGNFAIKAEGSYFIEIYDLIGNKLHTENYKDNNGKIDLSIDAKPGIYFVSGRNSLSGKAFVKKIVVE